MSATLVMLEEPGDVPGRNERMSGMNDPEWHDALAALPAPDGLTADQQIARAQTLALLSISAQLSLLNEGESKLGAALTGGDDEEPQPYAPFRAR